MLEKMQTKKWGRNACLSCIGDDRKPSRKVKECGGCRGRGARAGSAFALSATAMMMEAGAGKRAGWAERPARRTWSELEQFTVKSTADAEAPAEMQAKRQESLLSVRM